MSIDDMEEAARRLSEIAKSDLMAQAKHRKKQQQRLPLRTVKFARKHPLSISFAAVIVTVVSVVTGRYSRSRRKGPR